MTLHISSLPPQVLTSIFWLCDTRDLVSLATTSRGLSPLALRCIWHTIPSFATFIYTLHPDLWTYTEVWVSGYTMSKARKFTPTRELVADDFARFRLYSPLVRVVSEPWAPPGGNILSAPLWDTFQKYCPEPLPNLHTVSCRRLPHSEDNLGNRFGDDFYTLIGASLRTFELEVQRYDHDYLPRLQAFHASECSPKLLIHLGQQCPRLENFRLDPSLFSANSTGPLAEAVGRWDSLRSLRILGTPLQESTLKHLASLPCLYLLKANIINLPTPAVEDSLISRPGFPIFPALRQLVIHGSHLEACTRFVEAVGPPLLVDVVLYATEHATLETMRNLCTALSRHIGLNKLLIGSGAGARDWMYGESEGTLDTEPVPLTLSILAPLLSLHSLEGISLSGTCYASLDDRAILDLVHAWPNLESAHLRPNATHPYQTQVTLAGLAPLAALQRLLSFSIPLSDISPGDVDAAFKVRPALLVTSAGLHDFAPLVSPMQYLYVGHARLSQHLAESVSAALSAWFPGLEWVSGLMKPWKCTAEELARIGFESDEAADLYWRWRNVQSAIRRYVRVRKQEQRWAVQQKMSIQGVE